MDGDDAAAIPRVVLRENGDEIDRLLRSLQAAVLRHPEAAQALFSGLVSEGKRFAETEAGRDWRRRLCRSAFLQRAQNVFHSATLWLLEETPPGELPSGFVDAVFMAAERTDLESFLRDLLSAQGSHDD